MLRAITFFDINKRNDYINIVKELGFIVNTNTYSKHYGEATTSIYNGTGNSKTSIGSYTCYEVNIEKEIDEKEIENIKKLEQFFSYTEHKISFKTIIVLGGLLGFILTYFLCTLLVKVGVNSVTISDNTGILFIALAILVMYIILHSDIKKKNSDIKRIKNLKDELIKSYLLKKGIEIIKKY